MSVRRVSSTIAGAGLLLGVLAGPAWAHVEVSAKPARQGATDAVVTFHGEAESDTAGVSKLEITSDPVLAPDQVSLANGPTGWQLSTGADGSFVITGPALPTGRSVVVGLKVKQLPTVPQIVFKALQSYSDGQTDRWIELPGPDGKEPEHPAPILKLSAASVAGSTTMPTTGAPTGVLALIGAAAIGAGVLFVRRRPA